ncbi:ArnT family glycosyltransferase [Fischerella thermalis]|uniref:ArnT family glycosyltransferase n=1 Tax=Fischerella thermalis TaxID=372787 RepID=UPI000C7FA93F|nr:glycosyltransferase family 39 protein [Fischerella thermalis]MBF1990791.1 glycosyltransferase family 39 protein [Fischerella thermalis M58_A2018_009]MBF2062126.1 glycosyltransferase family 39 protein [Fischerella thermalis M66_A2018_004]MBF2068383.1 glycosyltransferase family 39 protein [Fischerella thermalis M48_A2018_028]PLZ90246.1 glycosyltransferase [Fischerella thermalis CCMEE 5194]
MTIRALDQLLTRIGKRPAFVIALSTLWLILVGGIAFFWHLGSIGLIDETEPLFAEASRQMYTTGDWITPFFNGKTRFDKPALIYWCQAIAYSIFGVNEWAVRLPSAIAAMAVISLAFYTVQWQLAKQDALEQVFRPSRRWLTAGVVAAVMALNPEMIVWGRTGVSDMLLTGCIGSALLCFFLGYASQEGSEIGDREQGGHGEYHTPHTPPTVPNPHLPKKWYLACYVLIAGAILTKGPVGIVLPGLIISAFLLYLGKFREVMREMRLLLGMLIILVLSLPWYVLVTWRNGWNYINSFFGYHNIERFTEVVNGHTAPWYFYFLVVLLGFAPYSVYLPLSMARLKFWQRNYWCSQERSQQLGLFAFFWFVSIFGFFTIAVTKLPSYVLPLMPAAAILVGLLWSDLLKEHRLSKQTDILTSHTPRRAMARLYITSPTPPLPSSLLWTGWVNVIFVSAIAVALFYVPRLLGADPAAPQFRQMLQQSGLTKLGSVIWLVCAVVLAVVMLRRRWRLLIGVNLLAFALSLIFVLTPALFLIDQERQLPLRELSAIAVQVQKPGEELVMVGFQKPTVVFYSQRPVNYIKMSAAAGDYVRKEAVNKTQSDSILVLAQPKKFPEMGLQSNSYQTLGKSGAYQLIRVFLNK